MTTQVQSKNNDQALDEQQVVDYLIQHPDFFKHHALLLADMDIPHESGGAVSLIERQVSLLRDKNQHFEEKLREMVDAVHDNQRLNNSLQRLAINLFMVDGLDDVIATIINELRDNLATDYVVIKLITDDAKLAKQLPERYLSLDDSDKQRWAKLIEEKHIQCGRMDEEQIQLLFTDDATSLASGALIPIANTDTFGVIGLGSRDELRYHPGMGTEFLQQLADLASAAIKSHLD